MFIWEYKMGRKIYWVEYPEKDKQGNIIDFQTLLDWAYEDTVGYSETGVQYVQSQPFSINFCDEDIILEDKATAKDYILDEMYPEYSGFDPRAYKAYNCAVRYYREDPKTAKKYKVFSKEFDNVNKYLSFLEEYKNLLITIFDKVVEDKKLLYRLRVSMIHEAVLNKITLKDTERLIKEIFETLKTASSKKDIPNELSLGVDILGKTSSVDFLNIFQEVSTEISDKLYTYSDYTTWSSIINDLIYINKLINQAKEDVKVYEETPKEVYWLIRVEKKV